jgi:hypothetical protein
MPTFLLGTYLFANAVFLSVPVKSPVTFVIQKTLCLDSPTFLYRYVAVKGSLGEEFCYKILALVKLITQVTVSKVFNSAV